MESMSGAGVRWVGRMKTCDFCLAISYTVLKTYGETHRITEKTNMLRVIKKFAKNVQPTKTDFSVDQAHYLLGHSEEPERDPVSP